MTHVITSLCVREGSCAAVCPVECIVPGKPQEQWPLYYIDPVTCIDCGACVTACPYDAIYPEFEIPKSYKAKGGEVLSAAEGTPGFNEILDLKDNNFQPVHLLATRKLVADEIMDFSPDINKNAEYFSSGPGYGSLNK